MARFCFRPGYKNYCEVSEAVAPDAAEDLSIVINPLTIMPASFLAAIRSFCAVAIFDRASLSVAVFACICVELPLSGMSGVISLSAACAWALASVTFAFRSESDD